MSKRIILLLVMVTIVACSQARNREAQAQISFEINSPDCAEVRFLKSFPKSYKEVQMASEKPFKFKVTQRKGETKTEVTAGESTQKSSPPIPPQVSIYITSLPISYFYDNSYEVCLTGSIGQKITAIAK